MVNMKNENITSLGLFRISLILASLYKIFYSINTGNYSRFWHAILAIMLVLAPQIIKFFYKISFSYLTQFIYLIFIFISMTLGIVFEFYNKIDWFDSFAHFLSGGLTAFGGLVYIYKDKILKTTDLYFKLFFINIFSLAIAGLWELFEFSVYVVSGVDMQHVSSTGVTDTMKDMIVALLGSFIVSIIFATIYQNSKSRTVARQAIIKYF